MLLSPQLLCLLGLMALGTVHASPLAEEVKLDQGTVTCPLFWTSFNGLCYKYIPRPLSWNNAQMNCYETWSHPEFSCNLASVHSQEEHDFILSLVQKNDPAQGPTWIGLNDNFVEDAWMWSDGSSVRYTKWESGLQPAASSKNCVYTIISHPIGGQWDDYACSFAYPSVCVLRTN